MSKHSHSKAPQVTTLFWFIKIAATTLGETAGDAVTMSLNLGYLTGTLIFLAIFIIAVSAQVKTKTFHASIYWITIIASTTVGTTIADFADRSLGIGYLGGTTLLLTLLGISFLAWHLSLGTISATKVTNAKAEIFYWLTIMISQTLGTAMGDWVADTAGMGYDGGIVLFGALLATIVAAKYLTNVHPAILFWLAFILTRPFGAVLGDFLDKPLDSGGLALSRYSASFTLLFLMMLGIYISNLYQKKCQN